MILDPKPMKKFISIIFLLSIFRPSGFAQPGLLDASFGTSGTIVNPFPSGYSYGKAVAIQSDGRIVVAGNRFTGSYSDEENIESPIEVYDAIGRLVLKAEKKNSFAINTSDWSRGVYFVKVKSNGEVFSFKAVLN